MKECVQLLVIIVLILLGAVGAGFFIKATNKKTSEGNFRSEIQWAEWTDLSQSALSSNPIAVRKMKIEDECFYIISAGVGITAVPARVCE